MRLKSSLLLLSLITLLLSPLIAAQNYPASWQVNGNGYTGTLELQSVDPVTNKVAGTLLGTPVEGYLVGRHLVLHRFPQGKTQIWEAWIIDPSLGAPGQANYDASFFMAGYVSENNGALDGVYPWYGLSFNTSTPATTPTTTPIPSGTINYPSNGHKYKLFTSNQTWKEAKLSCENQGGYLATLTSQAENDFVYNNLIAPNGHYTWLGGTDENSEGNWRWVTGETWSYNNWPSNQPDNYQGNEHYLHSYYGQANSWNDLANDHRAVGYETMSFVCEWGAITIQPPPPPVTGATNYPNNGHNYKLFDSKMTWKEAKAFCKNQGGYLATLSSKAENDFVYNNLISASGHLLWLGGTDEISEGNWQWITGLRAFNQRPIIS